MSYAFTAAEHQQILDAINASSGLVFNTTSKSYDIKTPAVGTNATPFYQILSDILTTKLDDPSELDAATVEELESSLRWINVAIGANSGVGMHSAFIRAYTNRQGVLRLGSEFTAEQMQQASNAVARNFANSLLSGAVGLEPWTVPRIDQIAKIDAEAIGEILFGGELDTEDTAITVNAAWSGTLGFSLLGGTDFYR